VTRVIEESPKNGGDHVVPSQNLVDGLIVEVSALGVKLADPDD
jgi:hypothetical protein